MRKILLMFFSVFLFALNIKEINSTVPFEKLDFSDSVYIVPADYIGFVFKHPNIKIAGIRGREKGVILVHKKSLLDIRTIANPNLATKIILNSVNKNYKTVNVSLSEFLNSKDVDAIYLPDKTFNFTKNLYVYHVNRFVFFPKKIIIGDKRYLEKHKSELYRLKNNSDILFNALILYKYYKKDLTSMKNIVYFKSPKSKLVKVYITPNWPPFAINENGRLKGIGIDFWKLIAQKANIDYVFIKAPNWSNVLNKIKSDQADVTPSTSETKKRKKFAYFSKTYISFPLGIVCRRNEHFNSIKDIHTIAVGKNFTAEKLMKKYYANIEYIESKNTFDALKKVENSEVECAVDILPSLMWHINRHSINDLTLEFKTPFTFDLKVMVSKNNKDLLIKINNAIDSINKKEKNKIVSKYSSVILVEKNIKVINVWIILFFIIVLAVVIIILLKFKRRSETDEMTKILNRATIEREFKDVLKKTNGSVMFLDLDKFKHINDTYGHEKGDKVLKEFSEIVCNKIRSTDIFGRWGGEEFVLVLPETDFENAIKKAEKIREKIQNHDFRFPVTVSIGVSDFKKGEKIDDVIKRADECVYKAKNEGRNRVEGKKNKKD